MPCGSVRLDTRSSTSARAFTCGIESVRTADHECHVAPVLLPAGQGAGKLHRGPVAAAFIERDQRARSSAAPLRFAAVPRPSRFRRSSRRALFRLDLAQLDAQLRRHAFRILVEAGRDPVGHLVADREDMQFHVDMRAKVPQSETACCSETVRVGSASAARGFAAGCAAGPRRPRHPRQRLAALRAAERAPCSAASRGRACRPRPLRGCSTGAAPAAGCARRRRRNRRAPIRRFPRLRC